jgi:glycosyltransferase involved in cell wall biosynthesis
LSKERRKYKIAFVGNTAWSMYNFRLGIIRKLRDEGHEIVVIAPKDTFSTKLVSEGVSYIHIPMENYGTNWLEEFKTLLRFVRLYRRENFDFIFHYTIKPNIYGGIAAAINRTPFIAITTGLGHFLNFKKSPAGIMMLLLYRLTGTLSKEVWFLNEDDKNIFVQKNIVKEKKSRIIKGEGINTDWFKPNDYGKQHNNINFLYAGRVLWDKGIGDFITVARRIRAKYPQTRFSILGFVDPSNPNAVEYEQLLNWQKEGIIDYLGETVDVRPFIEKSDCLLFPSYYREGLSRILLEAAAMERPIVTYDNVGCRDLVEDGVNGYLCDLKDVDMLESKIKQFIDLDREGQIQMGKNGRAKIIEDFAEENIWGHYFDAVEKYLD